jgi:alkyldihydroxyacetonephosphate synthase
MHKRWNGWGYQNVHNHLTPEGLAFLEGLIGPGRRWPEVALTDFAKGIPSSSLAAHPLIHTDSTERIQHSTGQSFPDWITMNSGRYPRVVEGVAYPTTNEEVRDLLRYGRETGTKIVPYGGGTSVVGHLTPVSDAPTLSVDMSRLRDLLSLDEKSQLAVFQAGIPGPDIEAKLRTRGYTLGHYPQSFEFSTLGGWIATRSSGQQSRHYGRIEQLFAGGTVETPRGPLEMRPLPASAAGPDLREIVLGSEGRLGIITDAVVRISRLPEQDIFEGYVFPHYEAAEQAARAIAQAAIPYSMLRVSNANETRTNLTLSGHWAVGLLERYLGWRGAADEKSLMIYALTGSKRIVRASKAAIGEIAAQYGGIMVGALLGKGWQKNRFRSAYLRNALWDNGYGVDTLETALPWTQVGPYMQAVESVIRGAAQSVNLPIHIFTHLSHVYASGSSVYTTYVFPLMASPDEMLAAWKIMKDVATQAMLNHGGTVSHQHGVGKDHAPYLPQEKGVLWIDALDHIVQHFDPTQMMTPGILLQKKEDRHVAQA